MPRFRFRLTTLFGFVTLLCLALGGFLSVIRPGLERRRFLAYLRAEYGNRPWAGVRYDHESEIGELYARTILEDMCHRIVEVQFNETFEHDDDMALRLSRFSSIESLNFGNSGMTDRGVGYLCKMPKLNCLIIESGNFEDKGLDALANLSSLRRLDIRGANLVTVEAVGRFRRKRPDIELLENAWWTEDAESRPKQIESGLDFHEHPWN